MKTRFVLASSSPRRIELLKAAGIQAASHSPDCDETPLPGEAPRALVRRLSRAKAESVASALECPKSDRLLVIAADTIVVEPSRRSILGKPADKREAQAMLSLICGRTHEVLTGYCVLELKPVARSNPRAGVSRVVSRIVSTRVTMFPLNRRQILDYIETGEPMDKAGAYAAQGLGMNFIESIRGSYTNVVGLPMAQLIETLSVEFGVELRMGK